MTKQAQFIEIIGDHRVNGAPVESNGWVVWPSRHSPATLSKFIDRAKRAGFSSAFCRPGKIGVRAEHLS